ncbi:hypothetical protein [Streptomyces sp. MNP-20]|uniref:hypothetical protein n=1 Tax=Streptomyces sp. MNP-20 TaxID=2721165 RepID=UPI001557D78D|nr:hypothetical protein [Streptomyces sp. MNP-20]
MRTRTAAVLLALLAATTAACSSDDSTKADTKACKSAMRQQFEDALKAGSTASPGTRPDACEGVDAATLQKIVADLVTEGADDELDEYDFSTP